MYVGAILFSLCPSICLSVHLLSFGPCRGYLISTAYWQFLVYSCLKCIFIVCKYNEKKSVYILNVYFKTDNLTTKAVMVLLVDGRRWHVSISSVSALSFTIYLIFLYLSLSFPLLAVLSLFFLSLGENTKCLIRIELSLSKNSVMQYILQKGSIHRSVWI